MNTRFSGHLAMLLATIMWGAMAPIAKSVLEQGVLDGWRILSFPIHKNY